MRAVVLSGGGGKGAYQIGAWKALRRMGIHYDIVTGTSIGALNGALMVQNDYWKALWLWMNIDFSRIYNVKLQHQYGTKEGNKEIFDMYKQNILHNGGMDVSRIESIISHAVKPQKILQSKINFGIMTFNLSSFKPLALTKDKMGAEQIHDYLMASATCYPAFKMKEINGEKFVDGGFYDNLPINLAIDMGADEIIAIDLDAIGLKQVLKKKNVKITYIKPQNKLNSFLVFNRGEARRAMHLGYNDTMKAFDRLDGKKYTFKHHQLHKNYDQLKPSIIAMLNDILAIDEKNKSIIDSLYTIAAVGRLQGNMSDKKMMHEINKTIEYLGRLFEIDDAKIYSMSKFNEILFAHIMSTEEMSSQLIETKLKENKITDLLNTKFIVKYLFNKMNTATQLDNRELYRLAILFPKEFMAALYLSIL